jgi:hypothetical protein
MPRLKDEGAKCEGSEIEIDPDAIERFRGAVHALAKAKPHHREAVKSGPKHRAAKKRSEPAGGRGAKKDVSR